MVVLGALWALTFAQSSLEAQGRATLEVTGGSTPIPTQTGHEYAVTTALTPLIEGRAATPQTSSRLLYSARLLLRAPSYGLGLRPLVLHTLRAEEIVHLSPRTTWQLAGSWSRGETDYWGLAQSLTRTQTALPVVVGLQQISAQTAVTHRLSPVWDLGLSVQANHMAPITAKSQTDPTMPNPDPMMKPPFDPTLNLSRSDRIVGTGYVGRGISANQRIRGIGVIAYESLGDRLRVLSIGPALGWSYAPTLDTSYTVSAGASFLRTDDMPLPSAMDPIAPTQPQRTTTISPSADVAIRQRLGIVTRTIFAVEASAGLGSYLDPFVGKVSPVGQARLRFGFTTPPRLSGDLELFFTANLGPEPENRRLDTLMGIQAPLTYRPQPGIDLSVGFRMIQRGPNLKADDFAFVQHDIGLYASVSAWFDLHPGRSAQGGAR